MGSNVIGHENLKNKKSDISKTHIKGSSWVRSGIIFDYIKENININQNIIEVGVAGGDLSKSLYDKNYKNLILLDINNYLKYPELEQYLKTLDISRDNIPLVDNSIDVAISIALIEHLENPFNFISEIKRVLKSGGRLIISFPNNQTILDKIRFMFSGNLFGYRKNNNHIFIITPDMFYKLFLNDFTIEKVMYKDPYIPFLKPRKLNKLLPSNKLFSLKVCYILTKK